MWLMVLSRGVSQANIHFKRITLDDMWKKDRSVRNNNNDDNNKSQLGGCCPWTWKRNSCPWQYCYCFLSEEPVDQRRCLPLPQQRTHISSSCSLGVWNPGDPDLSWLLSPFCFSRAECPTARWKAGFMGTVCALAQELAFTRTLHLI